MLHQWEIFKEAMKERKVTVHGEQCMAIPYSIGADLLELVEKQGRQIIKCREVNDGLDELASHLLIIVMINMGIRL